MDSVVVGCWAMLIVWLIFIAYNIGFWLWAGRELNKVVESGRDGTEEEED